MYIFFHTNRKWACVNWGIQWSAKKMRMRDLGVSMVSSCTKAHVPSCIAGRFPKTRNAW